MKYEFNGSHGWYFSASDELIDNDADAIKHRDELREHYKDKSIDAYCVREIRTKVKEAAK